MDIDIYQQVKSELEESEEVAWMGQPRARIITGGGIFLMLFGAAFTAFSLFWFLTSQRENARLFFQPTLMDKLLPWFAVPFFIIGIALVLSPIWIYRSTKNTIYAITTKRCLIISAGKTKKVQSFMNEKINNTEKVQYSDGYGNIIFAKEEYTTSDDDNSIQRRTRDIGFLDIPEVNEVEKKLKSLRHGDASSASWK